MNAFEKARCRSTILAARVLEWLRFDSIMGRKLAAFAALCLGALFELLGKRHRAVSTYFALHRSAYSERAGRFVERLLKSTDRMDAIYRAHVDSAPRTAITARFFSNPEELLGSLCVVLKSPANREKGVLVFCLYSYAFPLFAKLFNVLAVSERYYFVLEPSWAGYCDLDLLCFAQYAIPVGVEGYEPRDAEFIRRIGRNFYIIPTGNNWWVDHRLFRPLPDVEKDIDLIMIAGWGAYKRHHRLFAALQRLRRRGIRPRVLLIGYGLGMSQDVILDQAKAYGVIDQIECHEGLGRDEVNRHLNRSRVNILWSRKEGQNRALIEGMFAGVPCILREGHNYGSRYPFINDQTGCYSSEEDLPDTICRMIDRHADFQPREWAMGHMSCQRAAQIVGENVGRIAEKAREQWSGDLAVKVNGLNCVYYWDAEDAKRFADDYAFLRTTVRK